MDRNTITGLILIVLIMLAWSWWAMPTQEDLDRQRAERAERDSIAALQMQPDTLFEDDQPRRTPSAIDQGERDIYERDTERPMVAGVFSSSETDTTRFTVVTDRYRAVFTNLGGGPSEFFLLEHNNFDGSPLQMISDTLRSAYSLGFLSRENYNIETDRLLFRQLNTGSSLRLRENETGELSYALELEDGSRIIYTYTFSGDMFKIDFRVELDGIRRNISDNYVDLSWKPRLNFTELDRTQDGLFTSSYIFAGGVLENFVVDGPGRNEMQVNGNIDWVATRTKFFTQIIKPTSGSNAAILIGEIDGPKDQQTTSHHYQSTVQSLIPDNDVLTYEFYIGPLRYYDLREFDDKAYDMVDISFALMRWFADPFVKWIIIPFFTYLSVYIPNYGVLIILFAVAVKLALAPLTKKSFQSMAAMKELQPLMKEIQEKYKDNPQKQQQETIKLYKKAKVNPLGGCLPMLLQFPILITLWRYFQSSILIRQESFLWANDLSAPDYILNLPIAIPFMGDQLAGFVLLMTAAMFFQTKLTGGMSTGTAPGAPNMKAFTYILPVMLLFIFNNFAAGLSLYYLIYNVLSIAHQMMINKQMEGKQKLNLAELMGDDKPKKKGKGKKKK